jgi:thioredoxin reductase (NADPH)
MTELATDATHRLIVIGSGPAGYTAAIYAARAGLKPLIIEGALAAGGALMTTTEVENFPGFPEGVDGPTLMMEMRAQAERFGAELIGEDAVSADLTGPIKTVRTEDGAYTAEAVILAMGSEYRKLGLDAEERLSGHGISWCATCDAFFFKDQDVVVVGGGDSAIEEATFLSRFASSITLVHRRDELRASQIMQQRAIDDPKISFAWNHEITGIKGEEAVNGLTLREVNTGATRDVDVTGLFVAIGHDPRSALVRGQVDLDEHGYVLVEGRTTRTNLDGVFACGDLVDHTYRQAITAAGSGCSAALDAERYLSALAQAHGESRAAAL